MAQTVAMTHLMDHPLVYRVWQAPFAEQKLAPFLKQIGSRRPRRVLDVGCGPGTNARHFRNCEYLGVDINPSYIESATRRYGPRFRVADVTDRDFTGEGEWDCILVNSLMHHLTDDSMDEMLRRFPGLLSREGTVHVLDLVMPDRASVARWLARHDRGRYPRSLPRWKELLTRHLRLSSLEEYEVGAGGVTLWKMLYFTGTRP
jgi:trans-aconitate methyltransferase